MTHLALRNVETGQIIHHDTHGLFIAIGHKPASELFVGQLPMKHGGYLIVTPGNTMTSCPASMRRAMSPTTSIARP